MTNAEKYKEVFGLEVDRTMCPTEDCNSCPCVSITSDGHISCGDTYKWWVSEYKGGAV